MKIAGIIAEYDPFHNGHAWHIRQTRRMSGCDAVIVCMVGHFTQRGEPAMLSRWQRARMALACGADAVFDLPALFAVRTADAFARGGVTILAGLGADVLSFGSEIDDMRMLRTLADLREAEPEPLTEAIRQKLSEGRSHARARGEALSEYMGLPKQTLEQPNALLGVEYLRSIDTLGANMQPLAVPRHGGAHHAEAVGEYASAGAIRAAWRRGETDEALLAIPEAVRPAWGLDALHPMDDMLLYRLRQMDEGDLAALPDVSEGLEHRLHRLCRECTGREELLQRMKCKRYTRARLSRLLTHALLGIDRSLLEAVPAPPYARLIGFARGSEDVLAELRRRSALPIVSRSSELRGDPCFDVECRSTDIWGLLHDDPALRLSGRELREPLVKI